MRKAPTRYTRWVFALGVMAIWIAASPAAATLEEQQVGTLVEAWYQVVPPGGDDCALPLGCDLPAPPSLYPEDTLHVAATVGQESARTYFSLDLASLPFGSEVTGGTVRLPVAGPEAGTHNARAARVEICLVTEPLVPAEGGDAAESPGFDCSVSVIALPAPEDVATDVGDPPSALTFSLEPFAARWAEGVPDNGLVLLPASDLESEQTWRLAFNGRDREAEDAEPITATVTFVAPEFNAPEESFELPPPPPPPPPPNNDFQSGPPSQPAPSSGGLASDFNAPMGGDGDGPLQPEIAPPDAGPEVAPPQAQAAAVVAGGYRYPAVWLLPLVLLGLSVPLGRSLSLEMLPPLN